LGILLTGFLWLWAWVTAALYLSTAVAQVCSAAYALRQLSTAARMFVTVDRTWVRLPVL